MSMNMNELKSAKKRNPPFESVGDWIAARDPSFTEAELTAALDEQVRASGTVSLSAPDRSFWNAHSGITASQDEVAAATAANAVSSLVSDTSSLTAEQVAHELGLSASTIRHYKSAGRLYSYERRGKLHFPLWQFSTTSGQVIPSLAAVLAALPQEAHPQTIAGFFQTLQPDLVIDGRTSSAKQWLEAGGDPEPVVAIASDLASGY
jgi:hypothetical protein